MKKGKYLTGFLLFLAISFQHTALGQKQFNVLDWKTDVTLNTFLVQKMHDQYNKRRIEFAKATSSKKNARAYILNVRKKFLNILGPFPPKTPLKATVSG